MTFSKLLFLLVLLFTPCCVMAQVAGSYTFAGPVDITARSLQYNRETNVYTAEGDVDLKEGLRSLHADFVSYNDATKDVVAMGQVVFQDEEDTVYAERVTLNLDTKVGTIENGRIFVKKGSFYLSGEEITKTGETTYTIQKGEFTTCGWEARPPWKFTARDVHLTVEGYATARGAAFEILGYPIFYVPWGIFPVKTQRQSGFLLPELTLSSRDGAILGTSYFWAIDKDKDATFSLDYIEKRGAKPGVEYRYAIRPDLKGTWYATAIDDKKYEDTRWEVRGNHEQVFDRMGMSFKSAVHYVSDKDYVKDFAPTVEERSENLLRSTAFAEKSFPGSLLTAGATYYESLLQKESDDLFKYLPFLSYFTEYMPLARGKLFADLSADYVDFYREEGATYQRLNFEPTVRYPLSLNGFNFLFSGGLVQRMYLANRSATEREGEVNAHQTFRFESDVNLQLARNVHTTLFNLGELQSIIRPRVRYTYIPGTSYTDIPEIDPSDRLFRTNTLTYSLNHYLNRLSGQEGVTEVALLELEQTYAVTGTLKPSDAYQGSGNRFSDIMARLTLFPEKTLSFSHESFVNVYGDGFETSRNYLHITKPAVYSADLGHSYTKGLTNELFLNVRGMYGPLDGIYQVRYSIADATWIDTVYSLTYHPTCWSVTLTLNQTRRPKDTAVKISFNLSGLTSK